MFEVWREERMPNDGRLVPAESGATFDGVNPAIAAAPQRVDREMDAAGFKEYVEIKSIAGGVK